MKESIPKESTLNLAINTRGNPMHPAILFLHGAGVSSWMWEMQLEALNNDFYCITVDLPGLGESHQAEWTSFKDTADLLAEIIRTRTPHQKAHVVGLSLGGYTAIKLLEQHPDVLHTVLVSGVTTRPMPNQWLLRLMTTLVLPMLAFDWFVVAQARAIQLPADAIPLFVRDAKRLRPTTMKRIYAELFSFSLPRTLASVPLLAVAGDKEVKAIVSNLADFKLLTNARAMLAPNAHHGWNGEHPELFSDMVRRWITQQPLPATLVPVG